MKPYLIPPRKKKKHFLVVKGGIPDDNEYFYPTVKSAEDVGCCVVPECKRTLLVGQDGVLTCPLCARVYYRSTSTNLTFNQFQQLDRSNADECLVLPTAMNRRDKKIFIRNYLKVQRFNEPQHRRSAKKVIEKACDVIPYIPSIQGSDAFVESLKKATTHVINQFYDTRLFVKIGTRELENGFVLSVSKDFIGENFSIPKDLDVTLVVAIICASEHVRVLNAGLLRHNIISTVRGAKDNVEKFESQVGTFINRVRKNRVVDFTVSGYDKTPMSIESYCYTTQLEFFCNQLGFPIKLTNQIKVLLEECNDGVWLMGKNTRNAIGACILHVIWDKCGKFEPFMHKKAEYSLRRIQVMYPKDKLVKNIEERFGVKHKSLISCIKRIKRLHGCSV